MSRDMRTANLSLCTTYEIDIPIEISIAVIVDIHVRYQFALKPTVTGQSTASYFNNFIDLKRVN